MKNILLSLLVAGGLVAFALIGIGSWESVTVCDGDTCTTNGSFNFRALLVNTEPVTDTATLEAFFDAPAALSTPAVPVAPTPAAPVATGPITVTITAGDTSVNLDISANDTVANQETFTCPSVTCTIESEAIMVVGFIEGEDTPSDWTGDEFEFTGYGHVNTVGGMSLKFEEGETIRFSLATVPDCSTFSNSAFCPMIIP